MVKRIVILLVVAAVIVGVLFFSQRRTGPLRVSGFLEADEIRLGSRVGGRVTAVHVEEGDAVSAGQLLVELDPFDLRAEKAQADALLAQRAAELARLEAGFRPDEIAQAEARRDRLAATLDKLIAGPRAEDIAAARARADLAAAELERARTRHERILELAARDAANPDEVDEAVRSLRVAEATLAARQAELAERLAGTRPEAIAEARARLAEAEAALRLAREGFREQEIDSARAAVDAARQRVQAIEQRLEELKIRAPADGVIETMELEPGDLAAPDAPAISMMDTGALWVRTYVPEDELDLTLGQEVTVTVDSFPDERFAGRITFIAREAEFTPGNVQTPEDRSKLAFRIKVRLLEGLDRLRPGMGADVWLEAPPAR